MEGVNAFVALTREDPDLVPEEFRALGYEPAFWDPEDVARAGATIALIHGGTLRIDRGYVRPEDEPQPEPAAVMA